MRLMNLSRAAAATLALISASACLGVDNGIPDERKIEETTFASTLGVNLAASTKTPSGAYYRDIVVGTGPVVTAGQSISIRYTGYLWTVTVFDSNLTNTNPLVFHLGQGEVISGFDETLVGVRVGGQRQLIIPPSLGYGPYDFGPIPGNSILVFNVEVVAAK